jgi:hypothetical protein
MREVVDNSNWKANAKKHRVRSLIVTEMSHLLEIYNDTASAVHLINIIRSKGEVEGKNPDGTVKYKDPYFLTDEDLLKRIENYREELDRAALESNQSDDE